MPARGFDQYVAGLVSGDAAAVASAMSQRAVLRVAVHDAPFEGVDAIRLVFENLFDGALSGLELKRILVDGDDRVVIFVVQVQGMRASLRDSISSTSTSTASPPTSPSSCDHSRRLARWPRRWAVASGGRGRNETQCRRQRRSCGDPALAISPPSQPTGRPA